MSVGLEYTQVCKLNLTKFVRLCSKATDLCSVDTTIGFITRHHVIHPTIGARLYFNFFIYFYRNISQIFKTNTFGTTKDFCLVLNQQASGRYYMFVLLI